MAGCGFLRLLRSVAQFVFRKERLRFGEANEPVQISAGDAQAAGSQRLVPVVFANSRDGQLDLVVAELALERTVRLVIGDVDDVVEAGSIFIRAF